jgi:REP element-mobilizing transposase RayT
MKYDPSRHHRHAMRLKGYDYSQPGAYFVTICIEGSFRFLSEIIDGQLYPSESGKMVQAIWDELPLYYPGVDVDVFVLMPDHVHGIILLTEENRLTVMPDGSTRKPMILWDVVGRFKSLTTARYRHGVVKLGWPRFEKRFWQRSYHESIIRDEISWQKIRQYILNNPVVWENDPQHLKIYHPIPEW